jgi:hypothetical protein
MAAISSWLGATLSRAVVGTTAAPVLASRCRQDAGSEPPDKEIPRTKTTSLRFSRERAIPSRGGIEPVVPQRLRHHLPLTNHGRYVHHWGNSLMLMQLVASTHLRHRGNVTGCADHFAAWGGSSVEVSGLVSSAG